MVLMLFLPGENIADIATADGGHRLIDRDPPFDGRRIQFEVGDHGLRVAFKRGSDAFPFPAALLRNPKRKNEVLQGDHRGDAGMMQRLSWLAIPSHGFVELSRSWLDLGPFHRKTVRIDAKKAHVEDVFIEVRPRIGSNGGAVSVRDLSGICSHSHQSLFTLFPSIWCAAVETQNSEIGGDAGTPHERRLKRGRSDECRRRARGCW